MHCHIQFKKDFTIIKKNGEKLVSNFFIIDIQNEAYHVIPVTKIYIIQNKSIT